MGWSRAWEGLWVEPSRIKDMEVAGRATPPFPGKPGGVDATPVPRQEALASPSHTQVRTPAQPLDNSLL